ncbi:hypothetical protein BD309DRAFT_597499 [Dichomitus squalens]|nr:hypothetical protein BD309DRAFT_597499 [Dichomitus squalens]
MLRAPQVDQILCVPPQHTCVTPRDPARVIKARLTVPSNCVNSRAPGGGRSMSAVLTPRPYLWIIHPPPSEARGRYPLTELYASSSTKSSCGTPTFQAVPMTSSFPLSRQHPQIFYCSRPSPPKLHLPTRCLRLSA